MVISEETLMSIDSEQLFYKKYQMKLKNGVCIIVQGREYSKKEVATMCKHLSPGNSVKK